MLRPFLRLVVVATLLIAPPFAATAVAGDLPDLHKTPGKTRLESAAVICRIKWGVDARHVTAAMKREAFARYGFSGNNDPKCVPDARGRHCEIDHLISRELGSADDADKDRR